MGRISTGIAQRLPPGREEGYRPDGLAQGVAEHAGRLRGQGLPAEAAARMEQPLYVDAMVLRAVKSITPGQMEAHAKGMEPDELHASGRVYYAGCVQQVHDTLMRSWPVPTPR